GPVGPAFIDLLALRRPAQNDVELGRQLADLGILHLGELDGDRLARLGIADAAVDAVLVVARLALDVALRREQLLALALDLEVDVRRAAGVGDRLEGAEVVLAAGAGQEAAEALEVLVALAAAGVVGVQVHALAVHLPDLDQRVAHRAALAVVDD